MSAGAADHRGDDQPSDGAGDVGAGDLGALDLGALVAEPLETLDPARVNDVVVVGGGVAGLVTARDLVRRGFSVTLVEAGPELGGSVGGHTVGGILLDRGAESFAKRGGVVFELLTELGLAREIVEPSAAGAWLSLPDRSVPVPAGGILGIPSSPLANDVIRAIGWGGALRAYLDRLMPLLKIGREQNLGGLVRKRMGRRVLERLVAPVTTGVYSMDPDQLGVDAVAPGLNGAMTVTGSLSGGVASLREKAKPGSQVGGIEGGVHRLVGALVSDIERFDGRLLLETSAAALALEGGARGETVSAGDLEPASSDEADAPPPALWRIIATHGGAPLTLTARAVVIATPSAQALELLATVDEELREHVQRSPWPAGTEVELVTLVLDEPRLDVAPRGSGVLVAERVAGVSAKALTHSTAKWPWLAELTGGRHVVRLSYGRPGDASAAAFTSPEQRERQALDDASALLGLRIPSTALIDLSHVHLRNAAPLAALGEAPRVDALLEAVHARHGMDVTGAWIAGTGLASVIPHARAVASRIRRRDLGV